MIKGSYPPPTSATEGSYRPKTQPETEAAIMKNNKHSTTAARKVRPIATRKGTR